MMKLFIFALVLAAIVTNARGDISGGTSGYKPVPFGSSFIPTTTNAYDLGSTSKTVRNIFFNAGSSLKPCVDSLSGSTSSTCLDVGYSTFGSVNPQLSLFTEDNGTSDANPTGNVHIIAGSKSAGTGSGGNIALRAGDSVGGFNGGITLQAGDGASLTGGSVSINAGPDGISLNSPTTFNDTITWSDGTLTSGGAPRSYITASGSFTNIASHPYILLIANLTSIATVQFCSSAALFTCSVNPVISGFDCADSTCSTSVLISNVTLTQANKGFCGGGSITIPAGHYLGVQVTSGTCTVLNLSGTIEAYAN